MSCTLAAWQKCTTGSRLVRHYRSLLVLFFLYIQLSGVLGAKQVLKPHAPNRVLVRFRATVLSVEEEDRSLGLRLAHVGKSTKSYAAGTTDFSRNHVAIAYDIIDGMSVEKKVEQLKKRVDVAVAEPDYEIELYKTPSDSLYQNQWHHRVVGNDKAWDVTTGSADVKVCVIDSGVDMNHPDVAGNILKGWNVVPLSDGNSYPTPGSVEWANFDDSLGHGTHVAGLVGAVSNNARGVTGGAWKVGLLPCRFITASGAGYISDAITCIRLCQEEGAHIYSNSWGGVGYSEILHDEIKKLNSENALFVVAAGNNNGLDLDRSPLYPASYKESNVLTIGSTTSTNLMSAFSNIGRSTVHLAAPGSSIYSTTNDGQYGVMSGTSMAAPIVCGAAALLKSLALEAGYDLQPAEIKSLLVETATPFQDGSKYTISGGRLNTFEAVKKLGLKIPKEADVVPGLPKNPENIPQEPNPEVGESSPDAAPQCGTTSIRGRPATQSSTYKKYVATYGNNGDCRHNARRHAKSCAITNPKRSYPWWTAPLPKQDVVTSVTITTRADCCSSSITGANIMVGNQTWDGSGDRKRFSLCGKVPSKVKRGSPIVIQCTTPLKGTNVAVYLPKKRTALSLCEVDVSLQSDANEKQTKNSDYATTIKKRSREDDECDQEVIQIALEIGSTFGKGIDVKLKALDRVIQCIDHSDPNYRNQFILVESDVAHVLLEFLNDESEAVGVKAATVIAALTDHCSSSKVRLYSGVTALENQSCNILFNPVQDYFLDAIPTLVPWTIDVRQIKSATAMEAISNICHFNKNAKMTLIEYLCEYIDDGNITYLELLDRTVATIDTIDEALASLLRPRCLGLVHRICNEQSLDCERITLTMSLISTLCEKDPSLRFDLVDAGGVLSVMEILILADSLRVKDAAVNTLCQMTLDNTKNLILEALSHKDKDFILGVMASLRQIIQAGEDSHEEDEEDVDEPPQHRGGDIDSCMEMSATVDYDEEAKKLLDMILSKYNDEGDDVKAARVDHSAQCSIM